MKSMKMRFIVAAVAVGVLAGCATAPKPILSPQEKAEFGARLERIKSVEILYSDKDAITVVDSGGSGAVGLAGLLGPIGLLAAVVADGASKLSRMERAKERTTEFKAKVLAELPTSNLSRDFAEHVAEKLTARGMAVKLTPLSGTRPGFDLATYPEVANVEPGHAALVIWNSPGITAESATAAYQASAVVEFYCQDADKNKIVDGRLRSTGADVGRSFAGLLADVKPVYESVRKNYLTHHEKIVQECFTVPDEKRPVDRLKEMYKNN